MCGNPKTHRTELAAALRLATLSSSTATLSSSTWYQSVRFNQGGYEGAPTVVDLRSKRGVVCDLLQVLADPKEDESSGVFGGVVLLCGHPKLIPVQDGQLCPSCSQRSMFA